MTGFPRRADLPASRLQVSDVSGSSRHWVISPAIAGATGITPPAGRARLLPQGIAQGRASDGSRRGGDLVSQGGEKRTADCIRSAGTKARTRASPARISLAELKGQPKRVSANSPRPWCGKRRQPRCCAQSPTQQRMPKWRCQAIAESAARLLDVTDADIMRVEGDVLRSVAKHGPSRQWPMGTVRPDKSRLGNRVAQWSIGPLSTSPICRQPS